MKKLYEQPEMHVVSLHHQSHLLQTSPNITQCKFVESDNNYEWDSDGGQ